VVERTALTIAPEKVVVELQALLGNQDPQRVVMAFDGDGTLWSGDVGEDLFRAAMREQYLLESAREALLAEAEHYQIALSNSADANAIAGVLMAAYLAGKYPERETCAMMTWCYAGRPLADVEQLAREVLEEEDLESRLTPELEAIVDFGRSAGMRLVLVSASPRAIVEAAGKAWGFEPADIAAATPAVQGGVVLPRMAGPVPYAEAKLSAGRALFGDARWLAAFGDNVFDIDMLTTAEMGVAVRPKPRLAAELAALGLRLLESDAVVSRPSAR
jgi:phosphoserine phosphatase